MSSSEASLRAWAKFSLISAHLRKFSVRAMRLAKYCKRMSGRRGAGEGTHQFAALDKLISHRSQQHAEASFCSLYVIF